MRMNTIISMKSLLIYFTIISSCILFANADNLKEILVSNNRTASSLKTTAQKIINEKNNLKQNSNENSVFNKKNVILNSFLSKKTGNHKIENVKSTNRITDVIEKSNNISKSFTSQSSNPSSRKVIIDSSPVINSFGNRVLVDSFTRQARDNNDQTIKTLQSDILRLSKARIKREDIIAFIKKKQPTFSVSDAHNLLVNVHIDNKVSLPGNRESIDSRAQMDRKQAATIEKFITSNLAAEASSIKNNISFA